MFELSVACKYLTPRWRQLSVSIISLISILVISLVVWLIVVFFSVTAGLEKSWIGKLITLTAPVRISPTESYYNSYYYLVDGISSRPNYNLQTIGEKRQTESADPYDPSFDEEPPAQFAQADLDEQGNLKDLVKLVFGAINEIKREVPGLKAQDYEMAIANFKLQLLRQTGQTGMSQSSYLGSFDPHHHDLFKAIQPPSMQDVNNLLELASVGTHNIQEDKPAHILSAPRDVANARLKAFFSNARIEEWVSSDDYWNIPTTLTPSSALFRGIVVKKNERITRIIVPLEAGSVASTIQELKNQGLDAETVDIEFNNQQRIISFPGLDKEPISTSLPLSLMPGSTLKAHIIPDSLDNAARVQDIQLEVKINLQGVALQGQTMLGRLRVQQADLIRLFNAPPEYAPYWAYQVRNPDGTLVSKLPADPQTGNGILLPRPYRDSGVLLGDRGYISYMVPTASSVQEQRLPIFVAGFYDPGVISIGGKYLLVPQEITSLLHPFQRQQEPSLSNGINVRFDHLDQADYVKRTLYDKLNRLGIARYWKIETYRDYDFTRDLIQQLKSEKNLFSLLATIIVIVACSNIISMLIILVNDKKTEIGILRSMGATSISIAAIFGICGMVMGLVGSLLGIMAAILTLQNLNVFVNFLSRLQGHDMFNPLFYGDTLPTELSVEALAFVMSVTGAISLLAGLVPAVKASLMRPSAILKAE